MAVGRRGREEKLIRQSASLSSCCMGGMRCNATRRLSQPITCRPSRRFQLFSSHHQSSIQTIPIVIAMNLNVLQLS